MWTRACCAHSRYVAHNAQVQYLPLIPSLADPEAGREEAKVRLWLQRLKQIQHSTQMSCLVRSPSLAPTDSIFVKAGSEGDRVPSAADLPTTTMSPYYDARVDSTFHTFPTYLCTWTFATAPNTSLDPVRTSILGAPMLSTFRPPKDYWDTRLTRVYLGLDGLIPTHQSKGLWQTKRREQNDSYTNAVMMCNACRWENMRCNASCMEPRPWCACQE